MTLLGRGNFPPLLPLSSCGWINHKIDTRQISSRKKKIAFLIFFSWFLLAYICFTMLFQSLLFSKVHQPYIYIYPLFFGFLFHLGHHRALSGVHCALQQVLSYLCDTQYYIYIYVSPTLAIHHTPFSCLGNHNFVLYICVSVSALHISSSLTFF